MKGSFFKTNNFCGTWVNDGLNLPFFNDDTTVFSVDKVKLDTTGLQASNRIL